jgi:hypothetical protein
MGSEEGDGAEVGDHDHEVKPIDYHGPSELSAFSRQRSAYGVEERFNIAVTSDE